MSLAEITHRTHPTGTAHESVRVQVVQVGANRGKQPSEVRVITRWVAMDFDLERLDEAADLQLAFALAVHVTKCEGVTCGSSHSPFSREEIQRRVTVDWNVTQPTGELMDHDSGSDARGVDRAARRATAALSVGLGE